MAANRPKLQRWQIEDAKRLRLLWENYKAHNPGVSQEGFAEDNEIGTQGMMHQYLKPLTPLNLSAAVKFAKGLGCLVEDFSPTLAQQLVDALPYAARTVPVPRNELERQMLAYFRNVPEEAQDKLLGAANRAFNEAHPGVSASDPFFELDSRREA